MSREIEMRFDKRIDDIAVLTAPLYNELEKIEKLIEKNMRENGDNKDISDICDIMSTKIEEIYSEVRNKAMQISEEENSPEKLTEILNEYFKELDQNEQDKENIKFIANIMPSKYMLYELIAKFTPGVDGFWREDEFECGTQEALRNKLETMKDKIIIKYGDRK